MKSSRHKVQGCLRPEFTLRPLRLGVRLTFDPESRLYKKEEEYMEAIHDFMETLKQGGKQSHLNLALFPLLSADGGDPNYLILEEALAQGVVEIREVSEGGNVPDLKLINVF